MPDTGELQRWYDDHAQALFAFLLNLTRNEADTRDLMQDVFLKLATRPRLLDGVTDVRAFLIRLAHNQAIDLIRRRTTRRENYERLSTDSPTIFEPINNPDESEFRRRLSVALADLPSEQRVVVHLKLWAEMTFEAIAAALDISPNTAASRYRYGIDKLRDRLRPLYEEINSHG